jgi:hypothetical protein
MGCAAGLLWTSFGFPLAGASHRFDRGQSARPSKAGSENPSRMLQVASSGLEPASKRQVAEDLDVAGTYIGRAPVDDAAKRTFSLVLSEGGSAVWNTFYLGKAHASMSGHWLQAGSQIVLSFDAFDSGSPPRPITFHYHHHELDPVQWDQSEWGRQGPPILHRARGRSAAMAS